MILLLLISVNFYDTLSHPLEIAAMENNRLTSNNNKMCRYLLWMWDRIWNALLLFFPFNSSLQQFLSDIFFPPHFQFSLLFSLLFSRTLIAHSSCRWLQAMCVSWSCEWINPVHHYSYFLSIQCEGNYPPSSNCCCYYLSFIVDTDNVNVSRAEVHRKIWGPKMLKSLLNVGIKIAEYIYQGEMFNKKGGNRLILKR